MDTDTLIQQLSAQAQPTAPLRPPWQRTLVWLGLSYQVWHRLYVRMQSTASDIRKNQLEFMLASFFL